MDKDINGLVKAIRQFNEERDWAQFHSPKNVVMCLVGEVGELTAEFQFLTEEQSCKVMESPSKALKVQNEIADVMTNLLLLCDKLGIDPIQAAWDKLPEKAAKYPVAKARGKPLKYSEL